jgi:hypothetical protein
VLGVYERSLPKVGGTYTDQLKLKEQNMYGSSRLYFLQVKDLPILGNKP